MPQSPIAGFYGLRAVVRNGRRIDHGVSGYLAIGHSHLSLHLLLPRGPGEPPISQSGFRRYTLDGDVLTTVALAGHDSGGTGTITLDPVGLVEVRTVQRSGISLRIGQGPASYLEFTRIE